MVEDGNYNIYDLKRTMGEMSDEESEEISERTLDAVKKVHILTFNIDKKGTNLISYISGIIVFVDSKAPDCVRPKSVWACTVRSTATRYGTEVYYATPLFEITPMTLMNISESLREEIISALWNSYRPTCIKEFERKYKDEVHTASVEEVRGEYDSIINDMKSRISELENQISQYNLALQSGKFSSPNGTECETDLSSEEEEIDLGTADDDDGEMDLSSDLPIRQKDAPVIPHSTFRSAPGFPEMKSDSSQMRDINTYHIERLDDETIYSESFTDGKYFVHISPDRKMLMIRPREYGSALCINHRIRLMGLGLIAPFSKRENLIGAYSDKYEGIMVYLDPVDYPQ